MKPYVDRMMNHTICTLQARQAVHAAKKTHAWGEDAARGYCRKRDVPLELYLLARSLEAEDSKPKVKLRIVK